MRHLPRGPLAALLATTVFFGSLSVAGKLALAHVPPFALVAIRLTLAAAILVLLAAARGKLAIAPRDLPRLAGLALLGLVANQLLFIAGLARTTAVSTTILATTIPVFTFLLAAAFGHERLTARKGLGAAVAFAGVLVLLGTAALDAIRAAGDPQVVVGDVLIILNSASYAAYLVLSRPVLARYSTATVVAWTILFGAVGTSLIAAPQLVALDWGALPTDFWLVMAWIVVFCTVAAYLLPNWALKRVPASTVASFVYLQPVVAALLAVPLLGEALAWRHLAGGGLIALGVWIVTSGARPHEPEAKAAVGLPEEP